MMIMKTMTRMKRKRTRRSRVVDAHHVDTALASSLGLRGPGPVRAQIERPRHSGLRAGAGVAKLASKTV